MSWPEAVTSMCLIAVVGVVMIVVVIEVLRS